MDDIIGKILLGTLAFCFLGLLVILLVGFRKRWYLIQHIADEDQTWTPIRLWSLPGMKPLCLMFFRAWGPFPTESDAALHARAAMEKKNVKS